MLGRRNGASAVFSCDGRLDDSSQHYYDHQLPIDCWNSVVRERRRTVNTSGYLPFSPLEEGAIWSTAGVL
jgi:hypothetical protein